MSKLRPLLLASVLLLLGSVAFAQDGAAEAAVPLTALSLLPALVAIGLAFLTREVLPALFLGIVAGGLVLWGYSGDINDANFVSKFFLPALGTSSYAKILLIYLWCLGGLMGMWERTGGALHFAEEVGGRIARGPRSALFFGWLLGCVFHQGGTISTVLAGTTVKPVTDKHRISHEELAYVVDSTASPIATVLPFNAWPAFIAGLVVGTIPLLSDPDPDVALSKSLDFFITALPYNFYAIFAVLSTLLLAMGLLPWVGRRMAEARTRARETGKLDRDGARPMLPPEPPRGGEGPALGDGTDLDPASNRASNYQPSLADFFVPIGVLLVLAVVPYVFFDTSLINEAFMASVLSAMVVAGVRGMPMRDILDGFVDGCRTMTIGAIILGLAVTIGHVSKELHTADYLITVIGGNLPLIALPGILTGLCMLIAFSCGTSWGTYAVVFPVAMPLAWSLSQDPTYIAICFGAVLGGAVFGDQCSPISDTTILSSMFTGCDLMDHVNTQLPLALAAAILGILASTAMVLTI
ncbi:MAG: sodium:proton antiporter [Alphaproteobacteria bacterium]|nr:sodium:proton antiporter [Alphaproteobacteria bacterium]MCB9795135.1 sodium:proton antiporter [Alphaproteobacteria bacterium]